MNPTPGKYFLHILHGQFSGIHFLISLLKEDKDDFCFISASTIFQIFGPKYEVVSKPFPAVLADSWWNWEPLLKLWLIFEKENSSEIIVGAMLFVTLYIKIASAWIFFWCSVTKLCSSSWKLLEWSQFINLSALSCRLLILFFIDLLWLSILGDSN